MRRSSVDDVGGCIHSRQIVHRASFHRFASVLVALVALLPQRGSFLKIVILLFKSQSVLERDLNRIEIEWQVCRGTPTHPR